MRVWGCCVIDLRVLSAADRRMANSCQENGAHETVPDMDLNEWKFSWQG
jgi:hypothetical protein